jgi:hypothetical protein
MKPEGAIVSQKCMKPYENSTAAARYIMRAAMTGNAPMLSAGCTRLKRVFRIYAKKDL